MATATAESPKPVATPAAPISYEKAESTVKSLRAEYDKLAVAVTSAVSDMKKLQPKIEEEVKLKMAPHLKSYGKLRQKKRDAFQALRKAEDTLAKLPKPERPAKVRPAVKPVTGESVDA